MRCALTDTFDVALAAEGIDIAPTPFDGDPVDPNAQESLDYSATLAFENFTISLNPAEYEHADIDVHLIPLKSFYLHSKLFDNLC